MAQTKEIRWTNGSTLVALPVNIGFKPCKVTVIDETVGTINVWFDGMAQGSYINGTTLNTTNGYQWMGDQYLGSMPITGWNQESSGSYLVVNNLSWFPLVAGVKIKVTGVLGLTSSNSPNKGLNGIYTVSSINVSSGWIYTVEQPNDPNPYQEYEAGGMVIPLSYADGTPFPVFQGVYGCVLGTGMIGAANSNMCAIFDSAVSVT